MRRRAFPDRIWQLRPVAQVAVGVAAVIVIVAVADFALTVSRIPDVPSQECDRVADQACDDAINDRFVERIEEANRLEGIHHDRAAVYVALVILAVVIGAVDGLRATPRSERSRACTSVGVAGVWIGLGTAALLVVGSDGEGSSLRR